MSLRAIQSAVPNSIQSEFSHGLGQVTPLPTNMTNGRVDPILPFGPVASAWPEM
jgi:hypothetical protein